MSADTSKSGSKQELVNMQPGFEKLLAIARQLRAPDGCPWDREQSPHSLRGNVIEEAYELVEAINHDDSDHVREELGDVFLLPTMIAVMYEEQGQFTAQDVFAGVCDKLIRRHPHVFGESDADTSDKVLAQWNDIKVEVEGRRRKDSVLDAVKQGLPPMERAYKLQKAAAKAGFDWHNSDGPWEKLAEELAEARQACQALEQLQAAQNPSADNNDSKPSDQQLRDELEDELGDLFFSLINVARKHKVDPALALHRSMEKFNRRFRHVEKRMTETGQTMAAEKLEVMDSYWDEAKKLEN